MLTVLVEISLSHFVARGGTFVNNIVAQVRHNNQNHKLVDRKWKAATPGGSACALRPWTERSEGSGSSHALGKASAWNVDQRCHSTFHLPYFRKKKIPIALSSIVPKEKRDRNR
ncbi:hypothetical protein CSV63_12640 [Sporosarcina sp. P34]|nr:hypothetical protein CSV63_12640 [Sporosarcina sp. P34]